MKAYLTISEKSITTRNTKFVACNQSNTESEQGKRSSYPWSGLDGGEENIGKGFSHQGRQSQKGASKERKKMPAKQ